MTRWHEWSPGDLQVVPVHLVVMERAERDGVVDARRAAVPVPPGDVVHLAPAGPRTASRPAAAAVAHEDGTPLRPRVEPRGPTEVDGLILRVHDDPRELAVAQDPRDLARRQGRAVLVRRRLDASERLHGPER